MDRRGRSRGMIPLLALHTFSEYYRLRRKPPVTAGLLAANTLIYLRPGALDALLPSMDEVFFNAHLILEYKDLKRFFLSPFCHLGEPHLVYNMLSLLWKGTQLESMMGSAEFASMVAALLAMSQGMTLLLSKSLCVFFDSNKAYYSEYSVGFSGILFAMKVVLNAYSDEMTYVHGLLVPARYAAWAELILIQMFVPGVSFIGHLGGILAGILYLRLKGLYSGSDPLTLLLKGLSGVVSWPFRFVRGLFRRRRISGRGTVGRSPSGWSDSTTWRCQACTYDNYGLLSVCEMCGMSRGVSGPPSRRVSPQSEDLSLEELRRRRVERFEQ
ncbi:rhomboid-like protein 14, mitochondrial [Punica granatum]|uniref:Rhomboid-like protein 14, mitochondrial n=1 Tax=Punica granatum TaxID=22663 RepID=A0A6P8DK95_PUNGR|nr:rhomboid-like protein 14, mitochondrial [Punica granatum]